MGFSTPKHYVGKFKLNLPKERPEGGRGGVGKVEKEQQIPSGRINGDEICKGQRVQEIHGMLGQESKGGRLDILGNNEHHFQGLKDVFDEAIKIVLNKSKPEGGSGGVCRVL